MSEQAKRRRVYVAELCGERCGFFILRKARKRYECSWCRRLIEPGEEYLRWRRFFSPDCILCARCYPEVVERCKRPPAKGSADPS